MIQVNSQATEYSKRRNVFSLGLKEDNKALARVAGESPNHGNIQTAEG